MSELIFEVTQEADGGFVAECMTESIFTQGDTWDELRRNVQEAVAAFFFVRIRPASIRLRPAGRDFLEKSMAEDKLSPFGSELMEALREVEAHRRGEIELPTRLSAYAEGRWGLCGRAGPGAGECVE